MTRRRSASPHSHSHSHSHLTRPLPHPQSKYTKIVARAALLAALLGAAWLLWTLGLDPSSSRSSSDPSEPLDPHQEPDRAKALAATATAPTRILAWTQVNGKPGFESFHIHFCGPSAPTCIVTHQRALLNDSAAILFSSTDLSPLDLPTTYPTKYGARDPLQPWVLYSEVSPLEHPAPYALLDPAWTRMFDYSMSYRLDADFPIPAIAGTDLVAALSAPLDTTLIDARFASHQGQRSPILWLASPGSCTSDNHRHVLVSALEAAGLAVDSLNGACPTTLGRAVSAPDGNLVALVRLYKFVLVLETSNCKDYLSRSLVQALQAQSLAIVDGPPVDSYRAVLGSSRMDTVIVADGAAANTSTPDPIPALVQRVAALSTSKQAYLDHMRAARAAPVDPAWRARWLSPKYTRGRRSGWCGLCATAADADKLRVAERASQSQAHAARHQVELRLAQAMADVDVMRSELVGVVNQHATSVTHRKRIAAKFGPSAARGPWNASVWLNASAHVPLPAHPLAARKYALPPKRALLAPDYSCTLGKWAPEAEAEPAAQVHARYAAQGLPLDYLEHALPEAAAHEVKWPRPVGRRKRGKSRYADLTGEGEGELAGRGGKQGVGVGRGAQVMDPSEASAGKHEDEGEGEAKTEERRPRLELEYPPMDADEDVTGDGREGKRAPWDVLDGMLVGLFVTGVAGMYASALGLNTPGSAPAGTQVPLVGMTGGKRKRVTSLTSAMSGKPMSPPQGVRLLPLRRQSVTHGGHAAFVTSPVQEEAEESGGLKVL